MTIGQQDFIDGVRKKSLHMGLFVAPLCHHVKHAVHSQVDKSPPKEFLGERAAIQHTEPMQLLEFTQKVSDSDGMLATGVGNMMQALKLTSCHLAFFGDERLDPLIGGPGPESGLAAQHCMHDEANGASAYSGISSGHIEGVR